MNNNKSERDDLSRFDSAISKLVRVPKSEIDKRLEAERKAKEAKKKAG